MPKEAYFDFNMTQAVALDINYCFKSENYRVLFDIYDQDPIEYSADGSVFQKDIEPIYRAVTDEKGKFSGEMNIPADLSEVWLSSDYLVVSFHLIKMHISLPYVHKRHQKPEE